VGSEWPPAWPAAMQWWRGRRGSDSGAMQAMLGHPVRVEARVGAREKLRIVGGQRGERSSKVVGGANGGRRRVAELLGRARKRSRGVL
jgi:hypothetical protein